MDLNCLSHHDHAASSAEVELSSIVSLLVEKSIVDAYLDIVSEKGYHDYGQDTDMESTKENAKEDLNPVSAKGQSNFNDLKPMILTTDDGLQKEHGTAIESKGGRENAASFGDVKMNGEFASRHSDTEHKESYEGGETGEFIATRQKLIAMESDSKKGIEQKSNNVLISKVNNERHSKDEECRIVSSTPIKVVKSENILTSEEEKPAKRVLMDECVSNEKLSSNLAVMIGDISGIDNGFYSDDYAASPVSLLLREGKATTKNESTELFVPSTLDLSDLGIGPMESYRGFSSHNMDSRKGDIENTKQHDMDKLRKYYENELRKLNHERNDLMSILTSPSHETVLLRLRYTEDAKNELESRFLKSEGRNHELKMEIRRLKSFCFDLERKARVLEADKSILQERNFKIDQERRTTNQELSSVQELLKKSISDRRLLEDELYYAKKREFDSTSRLSDSDATLRDVKDDLNVTRRDCADKDETIQNLTAQKQEIQANLNEALEQISRLEDASSQRAREKNLFHKLLEEYEVLYNQHHRIRNLYNEAMQKLDDSVEVVESKTSLSNSKLSMKLPAKSSSFRRKWSMSPTSPSIREQSDLELFQSKDKARKHEREEPQGVERRSPGHRTGSGSHNRNSSGSILSWETSNEARSNHHDNSSNILSSRTLSPRASSPSTRNSKKRLSYQGSYTAYSDEEDGANAKGDWLDSKSKGKNNNKEWVIQNVDGITRFDVVFSPSKLKYEQAERDSPNGNDVGRKQATTKFAEKDVDQEMETESSRIASEISQLESELTKLSAEKNEIESQLRRLPLSGSGRARRSNAEKQELLEERLDEVVKYIGNIRMVLKRNKAL